MAAARLEAPPHRGPAPAVEAMGVATGEESSSDCADGSISMSPSTSDMEMSESPKLMFIGFFKGLPGLKPPAAAEPPAPGLGAWRVAVGAACDGFLPAAEDEVAAAADETGFDFLSAAPSAFFPAGFFFGAALISMSSSSSSRSAAKDGFFFSVGFGFFSAACGRLCERDASDCIRDRSRAHVQGVRTHWCWRRPTAPLE